MADLFEGTEHAPGEVAEAKGLSRPLHVKEVVLFLAFVMMALWAGWVTSSLNSGGGRQEIVQVQLQSIIGEYMQAQARSAAPEGQAVQETSAFMAELDRTIKALGDDGKIVIVQEAIIAGEVPDVTNAVKQAVYSKIQLPQAAPAPPQAQAQNVETAMADWMASNGGENAQQQ